MSKFYAVTGRIHGDDEDTCFTFEADFTEDARRIFADMLFNSRGWSARDRVREIEEHGGDLGCYINQVLISETPIREAYE